MLHIHVIQEKMRQYITFNLHPLNSTGTSLTHATFFDYVSLKSGFSFLCTLDRQINKPSHLGRANTNSFNHPVNMNDVAYS